MPSKIPASRVPLVDPNTNMINNDWYRWLLFVDLLLGSGRNDTSLLDLQIAPPAIVDSGSSTICPQFRAYRTAVLSLIGTGNQQINMDTIDIDTANEFNIATGLWTPSKTGQYWISAGVGFNTAQADGFQLELKIYKGTLAGGSRVRYFYYNKIGGAIAPQANGADLISVTAGDTYSVVITTGTTPTSFLADPSTTWFSAAYQPPTYQG